MCKNKKSILTAVCMLTMVAFLATACGQGSTPPQTGTSEAGHAASAASGAEGSTSAPAPEDLTPITFTLFGYDSDPWNRPVALEFTKRTGVTIERMQTSGDANEKLNLMLASGDLPDLVVMGQGDLANKFIDAKKFVELDPLVDQYTKNIKPMFGDVYDKLRYKDGKLYYLSNWYGVEKEPVSGYLIKKDYLAGLDSGKAFADGDKSFTEDDFINVLREAKEKLTVDGKPVVPFELFGEGLAGIVKDVMKSQYGIKFYSEKDGQLFLDVRDPGYLKGLLYYNKLYTEGLLDKQWITVKGKDWNEKLANGAVLATTGDYWWPEGNPGLKAKSGPDAQYMLYKVVGDGVDPNATTYSGRNSLGWDAIAITSKCKDPVRAIKFFDYMVSEEGQYLGMWGIEGQQWDMVNNVHTPKPQTLDAISKDLDSFTKTTGVRKDIWFVKNGKGSDGTPYDLCYQYKIDEVHAHALKAMENTWFDQAPYLNLNPAGGSSLALNYTKIQDIIARALPNIINAPGADAATKLYEKMIADIDAAGAGKVEAEINKNYAERTKYWK